VTDVSKTIAPKSDQLNSDDLIAGPMTVKITKVSADPSNPAQPICVFFEGDGGKPYKPCKSMRRVFVDIWGPDGNSYPGRSMTLFRDPKVIFGGMEVGGIRISHMSGLNAPKTMALTASKSKRAPFTVQPLAEKTVNPVDAYAKEFGAALKSDTGPREFWRDTAERRAAVPADRLAKMQAAYDAWEAANPAHDADTGEIIDGEIMEQDAF
jgi:hypothetical protein